MSALLLNAVARRIGGSVLQRTKAAITSPAVAEERRRHVPRRMLFTDKLSRMLCTAEKLAPEEITRDIERKQQELCDAISRGKRSLKAATHWREQQNLFDAIAKARRGVKSATNWCDEDPHEYFRRTKPLQIFLRCIVLLFMAPFAIGRIFYMGCIIYFVVGLTWASIELNLEEAEKKRVEAKKKRVQ